MVMDSSGQNGIHSSNIVRRDIPETPNNRGNEATALHQGMQKISLESSEGDVKRQSENLLNMLYNIGENQAKTDCIVHRGISCNICNANPLTGIRYKCSNCIDYDVCARCEPVCDHEQNHVFLKITIPIPPLANPRSALLRSFYPGKKVLSSKISWNEVLELRVISHFDPSEIECLFDQYKSLCSHKSGITREIFNHCLGPLALRKNILIDQVFRFYDRNNDGFISFPEFTRGLSILTRGTHKEKLKYFFKAYDIDSDNYISKDDLLKVLQAHHQISVELVRDVVKSCEEEMMAGYEDTGNRPISAIFNAPIPQSSQGSNSTSLMKTKNSAWKNPSENYFSDGIESETGPSSAVEAMTQDALQELMDNIFKIADTDKDGRISFTEFKNYILVDPSPMTWFEAIGPVF